MAKVIYKEPASYFTPEMLKEAQKWDKEHAAKKAPAKPAAKPKTTGKKK